MCTCVETINDVRLVKARKEYRDNCAEFIIEVLSDLRRGCYGKIKFSEWRLIAKARQDKWKIKKGEVHEVSVNKMDGYIYSFRTKPGLAAICHKYELFPEC